MKYKILAFLSALTCCIFCASPICCAGVGVLEIATVIGETIFSDFIARSNEKDDEGNRKGLVGALRDYQSFFPEGSFLNPIIANDEISFKVPNYRVCTGKVHFNGDFVFYGANDLPVSTVPCSQIIEVTFLAMDTEYNNFDYQHKTALTKEDGTGKYLFGNALNVRVTDNLGNETNFVMSCRTNLYSHVSVLSNRVSIEQAYYDVYMYTGDTLRDILYENEWNHGLRFNQRDTNSINEDIRYVVTPPTDSTYISGSGPSGFLPYGTTSGNRTPYSRLTISDICQSRVHLAYKRSVNSTNTNWLAKTLYPLDYLYTGFFVTNNNTDENTINNYWTDLHQQNYYIDNVFEGNTIINKNNYNDWGGGALAPVFELPDVDLPSLPLADILDILTDLLPDVKANLQPSIDVGLDSLFDRLLDFYGNMPDIGLEWSPDLDNNNYWDIELPDIPDSGGGGGDITVNVTVDITRPLVSVYEYTDPVSFNALPVITTYTLPASVNQQAIDIVSDTNNFFTDTGLIPIYGFLTLIGIGIAVIFKGV